MVGHKSLMDEEHEGHQFQNVLNMSCYLSWWSRGALLSSLLLHFWVKWMHTWLIYC